MKLLIVEDSERLRRSLQQGLTRMGFTVDVSGDGLDGLTFAQTYDYDAIVLDLMLPRLNGMSILKQLRELGDGTPVLILSAKDHVADRVSGLESGADDYLVKPFAFDELCARIKALMRRRPDTKQPQLQFGTVTVDVAKRAAFNRKGVITLTPAEYSLLEYLALRQGQVLSKEQLYESLRSSSSDATSNVVEVLVCTLRKKIGIAGEPDLIKTRRGYGYIIE